MTAESSIPSVASAFEEGSGPVAAQEKGGGRPAGPQARARAILAGTQSDDKWAAATYLWDRLRAAIRKLPRDRQTDAWQLTYDAMTELHHDFNQQFRDRAEEGEPR